MISGSGNRGWQPSVGLIASSSARRLWMLFLLILVLWTFPARSYGALDGDDVASEKNQHGQSSSPYTTGPIITDTTIPQPLGTATLFMPTFLSFTGGNFSPGWRRGSVGGDFRTLSGSMQLHVGVLPHTSVYVVVPYLHNWVWNVNQPGPNGQRSANFGGLGDLSITGKHLLLDEQTHFPAVAGIFAVAFPSGHHLHFNPGNLGTDQLGRGSFTFTPGLNFFKYVPPVLLYANLWYTIYTGATVVGERLYYRDRATANLALELPLVKDRWVFLWELVSYYDAGRLLGHQANYVPRALIGTLLGIEFLATKDLSFAPGILIDFLGKNTSFSYTPNFSVFYNF